MFLPVVLQTGVFIAFVGVILVGLPVHFLLVHRRMSQPVHYAVPGFVVPALTVAVSQPFGADGFWWIAWQSFVMGCFGASVALVFRRIALGPQRAKRAVASSRLRRIIKIRQHGTDGKLFDMGDFISDVLQFHAVSHWIADIEWALGSQGEKADSTAIQKRQYSTKGLTSLYQDIYQTIDGSITAVNESAEVARLTAVDSSYWEVESDNEAFLDLMQDKYGLYEGIGA
ncbi:MAG: hypothetical protein AAF351_00220 [Pseudomonadota bacterium]